MAGEGAAVNTERPKTPRSTPCARARPRLRQEQQWVCGRSSPGQRKSPVRGESCTHPSHINSSQPHLPSSTPLNLNMMDRPGLRLLYFNSSPAGKSFIASSGNESLLVPIRSPTRNIQASTSSTICLVATSFSY